MKIRSPQYSPLEFPTLFTGKNSKTWDKHCQVWPRGSPRSCLNRTGRSRNNRKSPCLVTLPGVRDRRLRAREQGPLLECTANPLWLLQSVKLAEQLIHPERTVDLGWVSTRSLHSWPIVWRRRVTLKRKHAGVYTCLGSQRSSLEGDLQLKHIVK